MTNRLAELWQRWSLRCVVCGVLGAGLETMRRGHRKRACRGGWRVASDSLVQGQKDTSARYSGAEVGHAAEGWSAKQTGYSECLEDLGVRRNNIPIYITAVLAAGRKFGMQLNASKSAPLALDSADEAYRPVHIAGNIDRITQGDIVASRGWSTRPRSKMHVFFSRRRAVQGR